MPTLQVKPEAFLDFRHLPHKNAFFGLVIFEPPHLVQYGLADNWQGRLSGMFRECFRVLRPEGTLIFVCRVMPHIDFEEILSLAPRKPRQGLKPVVNTRHWTAF